jgi:hypothetical protein
MMSYLNSFSSKDLERVSCSSSELAHLLHAFLAVQHKAHLGRNFKEGVLHPQDLGDPHCSDPAAVHKFQLILAVF